MLRPDQIKVAEACYRAEPPLSYDLLKQIADLTSFETLEDRSEWFSRTGYAAAYGATARGLRAR